MKGTAYYGAIALALAAGAAFGQTVYKNVCTSTGPNVPEPLAEGRVLMVAMGTCVTAGGPMDGAATTQNAIWEGKSGEATLLSADGVSRKPGSIAAYKLTAGKLTTVMRDGKPAGWVGEGKGVYTLVHGAASELNGKTFTWTGRATGPRTYEIESKVD